MAAVDENYPYECAATLFGDSNDTFSQSGPQCSGTCPAGQYCGTTTIYPKACRPGTFCPKASPAEIPCPAGTYSNKERAESIEACKICGPATHCPKESIEPEPCAIGTFGNASGMEKCFNCPLGTFQAHTNQTACELCGPGTYNAQPGAGACIDCPAGFWSNDLGLKSSDECQSTARGFYSEARASKPEPCPEGTAGLSENLAGAAFCTACSPTTTSLPGSSKCDFCLKDYYTSGSTNDQVASVECTSCLSEFPDTENGQAIECTATTDADGKAITHGATSLESIRLMRGQWRLGPRSTEVVACKRNSTGGSPCIGGTNSGEFSVTDSGVNYTGSGFCLPGHTGPLCEVHLAALHLHLM
jgi:hypothetical protein